MKDPSPKQKEFCVQYLVDSNGKQAAIRAGYSPRTAEVKASSLLKLAKVQEYMSQLQAIARKKTDITREEVLMELAAILRAKITDYLTFDGVSIVFKDLSTLTEAQVRAIESLKTKDGEIELKLHGKSWTIDRVSKILGFYSSQDLNLNLEKLDEATLDLIIDKLTGSAQNCAHPLSDNAKIGDTH
jgi:phage terminase small subunit